jgi:alkanesulfonate monooxygenase SsuD/methylene tetrahydromethanopterin reductase-like flavin-dependent oxidoreductase (luciferase family)
VEFSLIFEGQVAHPSAAEEREVLLGGIDQAILADRLGFDRWYSVEHHALDGYAHSSAPEVFLSHVAAKTERIRIAHGVCCLPFAMNHPVRVAERTATLDILSGGRLDVGVGRSSSVREQETFGITAHDTRVQLVDGLKALVKMWTEDDMEYHSDFLDIPRRTIWPRPLQQPHPALSMACSRDESYEMAGHLGLGAMSNGVDGPNQAHRKRGLYDAAIAARGADDLVGKFANDHFGASVFTTILDDAEEARRYGMRGLRYFLESGRYFFAGKGERPDPDKWLGDDNAQKLMELTSPDKTAGQKGNDGALGGVGLASTVWDVDFLDRGTTAFGSADDTIQFVENMFAAGVDEVYFNVQLGGIPSSVVMETIRQLGTKVLPHFRRPAATVVDLAPAR